MPTLHTVNQCSDSHTAALDCLAFCQSGDAILFIEEGVYCVSRHSELANTLAEYPQVKLFALQPDLQARGLTDRLIPDVQVISDEEFVNLSIQHTRVISWF